jgi:hypothetical protein
MKGLIVGALVIIILVVVVVVILAFVVRSGGPTPHGSLQTMIYSRA